MRGWDTLQAICNWITKHMGHTKNVHFTWYRKEDVTLELTKMAKITAVDKKRFLKNRKIDDIQCCYGSDSGILVYLIDCDSFPTNVLTKH